jgi:hypothetical protein
MLWEADWSVLVTILGWLLVVGGLARILFPLKFAAATGDFAKSSGMMAVVAVVSSPRYVSGSRLWCFDWPGTISLATTRLKRPGDVGSYAALLRCSKLFATAELSCSNESCACLDESSNSSLPCTLAAENCF